MEKIEISPTKSSPYILIDFKNGIIEIRGRSILEESVHFYYPISYWIKYYIEFFLKDKTKFTFELEYMNTSSNKYLINFLELFKDKLTTLNVDWLYFDDDEDMLDKGKEYSKVFGVEFNYIEKKYINKN